MGDRPLLFAAQWMALLVAAGPMVSAAAVETRPQAPLLRFGVIAQQENEPDRMLKVYAEMLEELRRRLEPKGFKVAPLVMARDVADLAHGLKQGDVDMVLETMFATFDMEEQSGRALTPQLAIVRHEQREYHSVFFARKNGPIKTIEDLRGRTLVLQADRSTSAFAVPRAELRRRGIAVVPKGQASPPKGSVFYVFAGAELNQAIWVLNRRGDAGAFNEGDWEGLPEKLRGGLTIFHETKPLLRGLISFRHNLDARARNAVEETLLNLHTDSAGRAALSKAAGITRLERLTARDRAALAEWRVALKGASR